MQFIDIDFAREVAEYGVIMGYPSCCIKEFIQTTYNEDGHKRECRKLTGTGYIPCKKCNARYSEKELFERIAERREWHVPLPQCYWIKGVHDEGESVPNPEPTRISYEGGVRADQIIRKIKFTLH